jgi:cytochrome c oxidase assembly protein Cox11
MNGLKAFKAYVIGCLILTTVILGFLGWKTYDYVTGEKTDGTVIEIVNKRVKNQSRKSSHNQTNVTIRYYADSKEYVKEVKISGRLKFTKGETVTVSYKADNPEKMHIIGEIIHDGIMTGLWTLFVIMQVVIYVHFKKKNNSEAKDGRSNYQNR